MAKQPADRIRDALQSWGNPAKGKRRPDEKTYLPAEEAPEAFVTVIFDDEREYARFTDYVYDALGGTGVAFTDVPIPMTLRVAEWLLERAEREGFAFRPVDENDLASVSRSLRGRKPFDEKTAEAFRVPGTPSPATQRPQR